MGSSLAGLRFHLFVNDGSGSFVEEAGARGAAVASTEVHSGWSVAFGDYDRDGYLDLLTGEWRPAFLAADGAPSAARLLRNRGAAAPGHFEDVTEAAGLALEGLDPEGTWAFAPAFVDLDDDGWPDVAMANDFGTSRLFWNRGDGTFADGTVASGVGTDENGMGSTFGDYDGDGDLDWFVTSIFDPAATCDTEPCGWGYTGNRLYRNEGGRTFSDATDAAGVRDGAWGWGAAFLDAENDGDLDLVMTNGVRFPGIDIDAPFEHDAMRLWRNDGPGAMTELAAAAGLDDTESGKGLLVFDYDQDGDQDLFVVNAGGPARLFRNDSTPAGSWLRVRLVGRGSSSEGFGARVSVRVTPTSPWLVREIGAATHYLGQSERVAHFGLGPGVAQVARVVVRWPTGNRQFLEDVPAGRTLVVRELVPFACGLLGPEPLAVWALALGLGRLRRAGRGSPRRG